MSPNFHKNDYQFKKILKDFATKNSFGKLLRPLVKPWQGVMDRWMPTPRDFLLRRVNKNGVCCEIGVYEGKFSERIFSWCAPKKFYMVDPWAAILDRTEEKYSQKRQDERLNYVVAKFNQQILDGRAVIVRKTSDEAAADFSDAIFDFVYIDGDHGYGQVKKDLANYYPKVKTGGLLVGDDYHLGSVRQAVDEFVKEKNIGLESKNRQFVLKK